MAKLYNLARMSTATTGTGTITLGSPVSGFLSFAAAGAADGETLAYAISDGANSEIGTGTYTASGTTLTRTVINSTNSNTAISLSGTAQVFITPSKADILNPADNLSGLANNTTARSNLGLGTSATVNTGTSGATIPLLNGTNTWSGGNTFSSPVAATLIDVSGTIIGTSAALPSSYTLVNAAGGNVIVEIWETAVNAVQARYVFNNGSAVLTTAAPGQWDLLGASAASGKASIYYSGGNILLVNNVSTSARFRALIIKGS